MKSPRIYTYKVTFEEIPFWYWGVHKEKKFGEFYLGSPVTHKWMWEFYTPKIQILEFFPPTDEGWEDARNLEYRLILPDLNNSLCLNEHCGGSTSLEIRRRVGKEQFKQSKGIHSPEARRKQREMMTGRKVSKETRERLSQSLTGNRNCLGRVHTEKTKKKMSETAKANPSRGMLGKTHREETREKMSSSQKGKTRTPEQRAKRSEAQQGEKNNRFGTKHSEETKRKMSESAKRRWAK